MSAPGSASITPLGRWEPHIEARASPTACYVCGIRVFCYNSQRNVYTSPACRALLSPGDPFSVVFPYRDPEGRTIVYEPVVVSAPPSWCGVPCRFVRLRIGLPVVGSSSPRPFRLLALLPLAEIEDIPPMLRLGAEFLHANRASVSLSTTPCEGQLVIPF
jgi:hypothetical protein